jgi:DNA-directed RNA polymerase specialized sigma subunit
MEVKVSYREGHLVVAAVRVAAHRQEGRPPTEDEIAAVCGLSREWVGVLVSELERLGVLQLLTGPFETRVEIADHLALEKLPHTESSSGVEDELKEFAAKKREEDEKLRQIFTGENLRRREEEKMGKLADDFRTWKPKPPKSAPFIKDDPA